MLLLSAIIAFRNYTSSDFCPGVDIYFAFLTMRSDRGAAWAKVTFDTTWSGKGIAWDVIGSCDVGRTHGNTLKLLMQKGAKQKGYIFLVWKSPLLFLRVVHLLRDVR